MLANTTLAQAYLEGGQYHSLNAICNKPANLNSPLVASHNICYLGAFAQNNTDAMDSEVRWSRGNPQESVLLESSALAALSRGHLKFARLVFAQARQSAKANNLPEMIAVMDVDQSNAEAELGFFAPATEMANNAVRKEPQSQDETTDVDTLAGTALTLAIAGSSDAALRRANLTQQQAPLNSILNDLEVPAIHAVVALKQRNPEAALHELDRATSIDLCAQTKYAPVYYRGIAFMQLKQWKNAEAQFNRILEHRAIVPNSLYISLAQMQLGRALQSDGQPAAAQQAYAASSLLWKDADPDFEPARRLATYQKSLKQ
jgi:tetratricopeptide (TPR) repeat protein